MPPENDSFNWREAWNNARDISLSVGLELPEYCYTGKMFRLMKTGELSTAVAWPTPADFDGIKEALSQLKVQMPPARLVLR